MMNNKDILIFGGTGAMGTPLVNILSERGYNVYITSRSNREDSRNIHYLKGNALDDNFAFEVLKSRKWHAIVDFMVYSTQKLNDRIERLVEATDQYIFISSCRVFADEDEIITEKSPRLLDVSKDTEYLKTDEYALRKAREENIVRKYPNITIVRPSVTFNNRRLQLGVYEVEDWLDRVLFERTIVFSRDIASHITTMTYGEDVAKGIAGLIGNPKAIGEDFNIVTSEYMLWGDVLQLYVEILKEKGFSPKIKMIDQALNLRIKKWQYQVKYARLFNRRFDNSKIMDAVPGLKFEVTKTMLRRCTENYLKKRNNRLNLGWVSILQDREAKELVSRKYFDSTIRYLKYVAVMMVPYKMLLEYIER